MQSPALRIQHLNEDSRGGTNAARHSRSQRQNINFVKQDRRRPTHDADMHLFRIFCVSQVCLDESYICVLTLGFALNTPDKQVTPVSWLGRRSLFGTLPPALTNEYGLSGARQHVITRSKNPEVDRGAPNH